MAKKKTVGAQLGPEEERVRAIVLGWWEQSGMSQGQVGERLGIGQTGVSSLLRGRTAFSLDTMRAACVCFGHEVGDLYKANPNRVADPETERVMSRFRPLSAKTQKALLLVLDSFVETTVAGRRGKG